MRTALAVCSLSALLVSVPARAQFFAQPDLDYWGDKKAAREAAARKQEHPQRRMDEREFRWEDYEDPTTDVFWDDGGDYVPPRPLRIVAADPTPENVARYLRWQKRKMETIAGVQREIDRQSGVEAGAAEVAPVPVTADATTQAELLADDGNPVDWRRVELVLFYSSDCPHCQASTGIVTELERRGAKVIPVQLDWKERPPLFPRSVHYDQQIAQVEKVEGVPTWVVAYRGDRITMQGEVTLKSIEVTLKMAQKNKS